MAKHDVIVTIRSEVDTIRQPRHASTLLRLSAMLSGLDPSERDPYQLGDKAIKLLLNDDDFSKTPAELPATITDAGSGNEEYWYRTTSIRKIIKNSGPRLLDAADTDAANWGLLWADFEKERTWLPLSRYVSGSLTGPRGFTWWCNLNPLPKIDPLPEIICSAHKTGVLSEWVTFHTAVMRLKTSELRGPNLAYIPTIIHAFDSLIFHAMQEKDSPLTGLALNLERDPLEVEHAEVVAFSLPVEAIECIPVAVEATQREKHKVTYETILSPLLNYYQKLQLESR